MQWPFDGKTEIQFYGLYGNTETGEIGSSVDTTEGELVKRLLLPSDRAIVAGCGLGSVAVLAATIVGVENVFAYEPNPFLVRLVRDNVRVAGKPLQLYQTALDATSRTLSMAMAEKWTQSSFLIPPRSAFTMEQVCTVSIREVIQKHDASALLLDVEGAEYAIFRKPDFLWQLRLLILETHGTVAQWDDICSQIKMYGFRCETVYHHPNAPWLHIGAFIKSP